MPRACPAGSGGLPSAATRSNSAAQPATPPAATAYVYGNKPSKRSYRPEANYSFNSSGGDIHINRKHTGRYSITFFGMGSVAGLGVVHVSPEGLNPALCTVVGWGLDSTGPNLIVNIDCFTLAGAPLDTPFMAAFTSGGATTGVLDYVLAYRPARPSYKPAPPLSFNSSGGTNRIKRLAVGEYKVILPGPIVAGGTVKVSAFGATPGACEVVEWNAVSPGQAVLVDCFDTSAAPSDRMFTMTFAASDSLMGDGAPSGYAWGDNPTADSYTPDATYQYDTVGTSATVFRLFLGEYEVAFPSAGAGNSGSEQATAYGSDDTHCIVDGPSGVVGGQETGDVFCFDNDGNPKDSRHTMQWWSQ